MNELLKNLALDKWYKLVLALGVALLLIGLTQETKWLLNKHVILLAGTLIVFGLAEWKCDVAHSFIKPPNAYTGPAALVTTRIRTPGAASHILHIAALCLLVSFVLSTVF